MDYTELSPAEIASGYYWSENAKAFICISCGKRFEEGEVFPTGDGRFYQPERAARHHSASQHGSRLEQLLNEENKFLTLTAHQRDLLRMLSEGMGDKEIAAQTGATPATVRRQRFMFREKAKRARMYLAVYSLVETGKQAPAEELVAIPSGVRSVDDRFIITEKENKKILETTFTSFEPLRLARIPVKEKKKIVLLRRIAQEFDTSATYTEKQVNSILGEIYPTDYVTLRRLLIEYGFMDRNSSGSEYWMR